MKNLILFLNCLWVTFSITYCQCPAPYVQYDNQVCFAYVNVSSIVNLASMIATCKNLNGQLASIRNKNENDWLMDKFSPDDVFIGLIRDPTTSDGFQWVDGSPTCYRNWDPREPNNLGGDENCVHIIKIELYQNRRLWNDIRCSDVSWGAIKVFCRIDLNTNTVMDKPMNNALDDSKNSSNKSSWIFGVICLLLFLLTASLLAFIIHKNHRNKFFTSSRKSNEECMFIPDDQN